jgi:hypoxanthine phosphoribosyltransferase
MKKVLVTWHQVENMCQDIIRKIQKNNWQPDYVVGLTRGGLVPANLISQYLDCPMETLKVSLRDDNSQPESNLWMAEDAYEGKNILIVDDINDTGSTLNWIKKDWEEFHPSKPEPWAGIWGNTVRVATLYDNEASYSALDINYSSVIINKMDKNVWIEFPWENWWAK